MSTLMQQSSLNYVFRTITSFIRAIEAKSTFRTATEPPFSFYDTENNLSPTQRHQFRINTALSVCAVRTMEVIAVLSSIEKTADVSHQYVVVVNPRCPSDKKNLHLLPEDVLVLQTTDPGDTLPRLVSGIADESFLSNPTNFVKSHLSSKKRFNQTFQNHFQTLITIISGKQRHSLKDRQVMLAKYVVFSSYRKMHERITHKNSQPYIMGLRDIAKSLSTANHQQLEPLTLTPRDKTFLMSIQQIISKSSHDASHCKERDCKYDCKYKLHLPELCRIAEMAKNPTETPMFYTEVTLVEYHCLLVNLLEHFKLHLYALVKNPRQGHLHIDMIRFFGSALHNMVSSQIMGQHLLNIEQSLGQAINKQKLEKAGQNDQKAAKTDDAGESKRSGLGVKLWTGMKSKATKKTTVAEAGDGGAVEGEGAGVGMEEEEDGFDDSIASIQLQAVEYEGLDRDAICASSNVVAARCLEWLRLMVAYFDAMDQLLPTGSTLPQLPENTKVKVLAVKHQGRKMMDWETVCLKYLPDSETFPNGCELVAEFKKHLEGNKSLYSWFDPNNGTFLVDNFSGTLHCEAIASVLMHLQQQGLIKMLPELENLLGISKRCCPVCAFLIQHLNGFVIRGAHKTVSGCSLPPWLPEEDMKIMIGEFAKRLRKAIDNLLFTKPQTASQGRVSSGSICLSVMSFELNNLEAGSWGADLGSDSEEVS